MSNQGLYGDLTKQTQGSMCKEMKHALILLLKKRHGIEYSLEHLIILLVEFHQANCKNTFSSFAQIMVYKKQRHLNRSSRASSSKPIKRLKSYSNSNRSNQHSLV